MLIAGIKDLFLLSWNFIIYRTLSKFRFSESYLQKYRIQNRKNDGVGKRRWEEEIGKKNTQTSKLYSFSSKQ